MRTLFLVSITILSFFISSCGKEEGDVLSLESITEESGRFLITIGQDSNHKGFAVYRLDGTFVSGTNFRETGETPRGLVAYTSTSVLMSSDTTDNIREVNLDGSSTLFHGSAQFNGTIRDIAIGGNGYIYGIENNLIEVFDTDGTFLGAARINTTTGACVLNSPRSMIVNQSGQLVVVNGGGTGNVLVYDISSTPATCLSSVALGNVPNAVVEHSDGFLYIATTGDDRVYRTDPDGSNPVVVWDTNTSLINDPSAIIELDGGDLLVASSVTDSIERITTSGERVGTQPFIRDVYSLNISDMVIIGEEETE